MFLHVLLTIAKLSTRYITGKSSQSYWMMVLIFIIFWPSGIVVRRLLCDGTNLLNSVLVMAYDKGVLSPYLFSHQVY